MRTRPVLLTLIAAAALVAAGAVPAGAGQGPANGRITFGRYNPDRSPSLWVADIDGRHQHQLATETTYFSDWAPDGRRIAFDFESDSGDVHIATVHADGRNRQDLTSAPGVQECPKWSPDGQWITYDAWDPAQAEFSTSIWVMRADGSEARQVTSGGFDVEPVFSPDVRQILFGRITGEDPTGQLEALYVVNTDGSGLREVVPARAGVEHPDWSPDGSWITFNIGPEYPDAASSGDILAVHPSGLGLHVLRARTDRFAFYKAMWSPDGRQLLLGCFDAAAGREGLCTATAGGGRVRAVHLGGTTEGNWPAWGSAPSP